MRKCVICGKPFQEKNAVQKYCSTSCSDEGHRRSSLEWFRQHRPSKTDLVYTLVCKNCGKRFQAPSRRLVYCSAECRIEGQRKAARLNWKKYKLNLMMEHTCSICGKKYLTTGLTTKFCPECRGKKAQHKKAGAPKKGADRLNSKIKEAMRQHISYGQLQVIAAREAAKAAREKEKT